MSRDEYAKRWTLRLAKSTCRRPNTILGTAGGKLLGSLSPRDTPKRAPCPFISKCVPSYSRFNWSGIVGVRTPRNHLSDKLIDDEPEVLERRKSRCESGEPVSNVRSTSHPMRSTTHERAGHFGGEGGRPAAQPLMDKWLDWVWRIWIRYSNTHVRVVRAIRSQISDCASERCSIISTS